MAQRDLREFLDIAEQRGFTRRVAREVDVSWEPACFAKWAFQAVPEAERFGFLFENVAGHDIRVATGAIGASAEAYALALGVAPDEINAAWDRALSSPLPPAAHDGDAPCQEVVWTGEDARLSRLPVPTWTPGKDAAPYLTVPVLTRDADSGRTNMGYYRTKIDGDDRLVCNLGPGRGATLNCESWHRMGKPAPIAWVIGAPPVLQIAATCNLPPGTPELDAAGALAGGPVALTPARTIDLMVPAMAEIIIEGELPPDGEMAPEGPFGEFAGYMGPVQDRPVVRVTAITMRRNAIFYGVTSQMPPSESTTIQSLTNAGVLAKTLRRDHGERSVADVHIDLTFGGMLAHVIVAMTPAYPGHGKKVGRIVADTSLLKRVTVVDADVDIRDPLHMEWALNACYDPARDTAIIDDVFVPLDMDPAIRRPAAGNGLASKIVVDATGKGDAGPFSLPSAEIMARARESWRDAGLPEFEVPRRVRSRLAKS